MIKLTQNYQSLIFDDTIQYTVKNRNKPKQQRSLKQLQPVSTFSNKDQFFFAKKEKLSIKKPKYIPDNDSGIHYFNQFIEPYVVKTLTDTFFKVINQMQKPVVIQITIDSFNECKKEYMSIIKVTQEKIDEFRYIFQDLAKPRLIKSESIVRGPNDLEQIMFHNDYRKKQLMSITGNQKDFFHYQLIKYMRAIPLKKNNLMEMIRQHVIAAIGIVKCWDPNRERNIVYLHPDKPQDVVSESSSDY